jgi:hypothetical protein
MGVRKINTGRGRRVVEGYGKEGKCIENSE